MSNPEWLIFGLVSIGLGAWFVHDFRQQRKDAAESKRIEQEATERAHERELDLKREIDEKTLALHAEVNRSNGIIRELETSLRHDIEQRELSIRQEQAQAAERAHAREVEFKREIEAARAEDRARDPWMTRCGGDDWRAHAGGDGEPNIPDSLYCGRIAPEWFVHNGQCEDCASGQRKIYPEKRETEREYRARLIAIVNAEEDRIASDAKAFANMATDPAESKNEVGAKEDRRR